MTDILGLTLVCVQHTGISLANSSTFQMKTKNNIFSTKLYMIKGRVLYVY